MMNHQSNDERSRNSNNSNKPEDRSVVEIAWTVPGTTKTSTTGASINCEVSSSDHLQQLTKIRQQRISRCIDLAVSCTKDFNTSFDIYNEQREKSMPQFDSDEIVLSLPSPSSPPDIGNTKNDRSNLHQVHRVCGFYKEYLLDDVKIISEMKSMNDPTRPYYSAKKHFVNTAKRSNKGKVKNPSNGMNSEHHNYTVKLLQDGILETDHGPHAVTEMMIEIKVLCSMLNHPHVMCIYGIASTLYDTAIGTSTGNSSNENGDGYFFITDRIHKTLKEQLDEWKISLNSNLMTSKKPNPKQQTSNPIPDVTKRLEMVLDVVSALIFLHDRQIVYYIRPDKIGFDYRYNVIKLSSFGQCRQHNMDSHPRSIAQSDNMNVLAYCAPEIFCMAPATKAIDVYGLGILLWEMISLQQPFSGYDRCQHYEHVVQNHQRPLEMNGNENSKELWDPDISKLIRDCLHPYQRPTMKTIHDTLEYKLLYQEPENEIIDTAHHLQRRHSENILQQIILGRSESNKNDDNVDIKHHEDIHDKENVNDGFNASGNSILSGMSLDDMLHEVSARLGGSGDENRKIPDSSNDDDQNEQDKRQDKRRSRRNSRNDLNRSQRNENNEISIARSNSRGRIPTRRKSTTLQRRSRSSSTCTVEERIDTYIPRNKKNMMVSSTATGSAGKDNSGHQRRGSSMSYIDDEEELIASIMSQSDANSFIEPSMSTTVPIETGLNYGSNDNLHNSFKVTEVRRSLMSARSPVRLRQRSTSRSKSRSVSRSKSRSRTPTNQPKSLLSDFDTSDRSVTPPASVSSSPRIKLSPGRVVAHNTSRQQHIRKGGDVKSSGNSSNDKNEPSQRSQALRKSYSRSDSDSDDSLGIRRRRRASVEEVKQKFDFVPDTDFKRSTDNKHLSGLKQAIERATSPRKRSSQQHDMEKYPQSPSTNPFVQVSKNILNGVFRRNSAKDVEIEVEQPLPIHRRQMRRTSASLVQDLVHQQSTSARALNRPFADINHNL